MCEWLILVLEVGLGLVLVCGLTSVSRVFVVSVLSHARGHSGVEMAILVPLFMSLPAAVSRLVRR